MIELEVLPSPPRAQERPVKWGKIFNQDTCIGCHACSVACKSEHLVPLGVHRTYVKQVEVGAYPEVSRQFQITRCNQCENAPCVPICPVTAMFVRPDGIVDFDRDVCIGCKACIAACPYDAIYIDPGSHSAEKCNFCAHRIDQDLEPACVAVCPERAIIVGDLNDPDSEISRLMSRNKTDVRKPEKATHPKVMYIGASDFTLSPDHSHYEAIHLFSDQKERYPVRDEPRELGETQSVASARLAYDVPHGAPWEWRVSLYTWTKSLSAGAFVLFALSLFFGAKPTPYLDIATAASGLVFLGVTGALLIWDLKHPWRFYRIFTRPQWKSWLVRGSFIIAGYSLVLLLLLAAGVLDSGPLARALTVPGLILGGFTAIYTAFLFAQARARDLWQNPMLPLHLFAQALLAGAALFYLIGLAAPFGPAVSAVVRSSLLIALALHLAMIVSEAVIPHPTADAKKAARHMIYGRFKGFYWTGLVLGAAVPLVLAILPGAGPAATAAASLLALLGLLSYEHAYVQAGQSVPLS